MDDLTPQSAHDDVDDAQDSDAPQATRLEALRRLARSPVEASSSLNAYTQPGVKRGATRAMEPRRSRLIGIVTALVLLAVGATLVIHAAQAPQSKPAQTARLSASHPMQIVPRDVGLNCPVDTTWSPDGAHIAVLGYRDHCPDNIDGSLNAPTSGLLLIYDAQTGKVVQRALLDSLVTDGGLSFDPQTAYLGYQALLWLSDGAKLALPFFEQHGGLTPEPPLSLAHGSADRAIEPHPTIAGVLLLDATTLQRISLYTASYTEPVSATAAPEWNLTTGKLIQPALQLAPALGYHWGAGDVLLPDGALNAGQAPRPPALTPVGNPTGDARFTIWQAGETALGNVSLNGQQSAVAGLDLFFTRFAAWSPDGACLLAPAYYGGRVDTLQPPQASVEQIQASGWAHAPILPSRDAALTALYHAPLVRNTISWSPNGATLAVWNGGASVNGAAPAVNLYSAQSGRLTTALAAPAAASAQLDASLFIDDLLRWSPGGKRLALMSPELSSLIIWQVK